MRYLRIVAHSLYAQIAPVTRAWITFVIASLLPLPMFVGFGAGSTSEQKAALAFSYMVMTVMNAAITQVALTINADRAYSWDGWVRTLPAPSWPRMVGRSLGVYTVSLASVIPIGLIAAATQHSPGVYLGRIFAVTFLTALLFGCLGAILGLLARPEAVGNAGAALFFVLAVLGGVFTGGTRYPWVPEWLFSLLPSTIALDAVLRPSWLSLGKAMLAFVVLLSVVGVVSRRSSGLKYN